MRHVPAFFAAESDQTSPGEIISRAKAIKYYKLTRYQANLFSKDPSTKVGAMLLAPRSLEMLSMGYNGMPRGVNEADPSRWQRPIKYMYVEHAERNALYNAVRGGRAVEGAIAVVTLFPCADCARGLIQAGVQAIVTCVPNLDDDRWDAHFDIAKQMLEEAHIQLILLTPEEVAE